MVGRCGGEGARTRCRASRPLRRRMCTGVASVRRFKIVLSTRRHMAPATTRRMLVALLVVSAIGLEPSWAGAQGHRSLLAGAMADGPVYTGYFADPSVLVVGKTYYAYGTNDDDAEENLPVIESSDLVHWKAVGDAMPILPSWVQNGFTWSPSVEADPAGGYELFFNAYDPATHHECIGRATAPSPLGPFVSTGNTPFLCQTTSGGVIDALVYAGGGADYLLWKGDGETGQGSEIWSQELGHGDQTLVGQPVVLQTPTQAWEAGNIEGPALARIDGTLYLLFSGNHWTSPSYAIGATTCSSPLGPCAPSGPDPVLASTGPAEGPGGPDVFHAGQQIMLAYAATPEHRDAPGEDQRELYLAVVSSAGDNTLSVKS